LPGSKDCIPGVTYGIHNEINNYVWVVNGCRAWFTVLLDGKCVCSRVIFLK
jgi:hypothetical protein